MSTPLTRISLFSRTLLFAAAVLLLASMLFPIWRIDLDAPQYPEGLNLLIYANKLGGNVDIINGLNHYIGMKTLHTEDFIEFAILPYFILFFAGFSFLVGATGRPKFLYVLFGLFALFGVVAMVDFWRWEYNYGHNLDPNAAIVVPGMAYQPPLIGFKQLLNFGAFSIPDTGGWLYIGSGVCMLMALLFETGVLNRFRRKPVQASLLLLPLFLFSCGSKGPEPVKLNKDNCDYCKMTISDIRFATELVSSKGRVYKFDDLSCLLNFKKENTGFEQASHYVSDYLYPNALRKADSLFYIVGEQVSSPMGGNIAGFSNADSAQFHLLRLAAQPLQWEKLAE